MRMNRHLLAIIGLTVITLSVRYIPLLFSPLPFNIDGFPIVRISEDIIAEGRWTQSYSEDTSVFTTYNTKMPILSMLISGIALVFGWTPMQTAQIVMPMLSFSAVIMIYIITFRITKNEIVAMFAGLVLALNGFYLYLGTAVMKETLGLPLLLLTVYLYYGRKDPRKRALASFLLLVLTMTHHLTVWIAFIMISFIMITSNVLEMPKPTFRRKNLALDFISGPFMFVFTLTYYQLIDMEFFVKVSNTNDTAIFASVFLLGSFFCVMFCLQRPGRKPKGIILNKTLLVPAGGMALLVLNSYKLVFPGTTPTSRTMLFYVIPYLLLISLGIIGLNLLGSKRTEHKPFIAAVFMGPLVVITFALLKGFDAFTFILVYRSYDYIDFGLAICAGIGGGYIIHSATREFSLKEGSSAMFGVKASLSIIFMVICLATVPLAYNGQEFYGVQDATYEHEFEAMEWLDEHDEDPRVETDERLNDIMNPYFEIDSDKFLPWKLDHGRKVRSGTVLFMEDKWLSDGAQMSPMKPVMISQETFDRTLNDNNLVYSAGPSGSHVYIIIVK